MTMTWLANADRDTFWAHRAWSDFAAHKGGERCVAVLPLFGFADHGMGLPLDAEEIAGSAVLRRAIAHVNRSFPCRVLPAVRFGLAPYPNTFFGIDAETAQALVYEIARGVKAAGLHKLVFFTTSPWNEELIDSVSRDVRVELGLQTFLVHAGALGFGFHPASPRRAEAQAAVAHLLDIAPAGPTRTADIRDQDFRPGNFRQPAPVVSDTSIAGATVIDSAALRLAHLLAEMQARGPLGTVDHRTPAKIDPTSIATVADIVFPQCYRARYLGALTRDELEMLPDKERALVILPTGAIEQHGHHLPVGVDAILGQAWLEHTLPHLAEGSPVYVAPPFTYGKSNEHEAFPGTLTISARTLRRLLLAAATQLKALGFRHIAILNTHGGNSAVLVYTLREIQTTLDLRAGLLGWPYKPDLSPQEEAHGFHAGEWETSLMLAVADELVDMSKAVCEYPARLSDPGELRPEGASATFSWMTQDISSSGVMGDATAATQMKGERWLAAASAALARRIEQLLKQ